jgi:hypothetical protein
VPTRLRLILAATGASAALAAGAAVYAATTPPAGRAAAPAGTAAPPPAPALAAPPPTRTLPVPTLPALPTPPATPTTAAAPTSHQHAAATATPTTTKQQPPPLKARPVIGAVTTTPALAVEGGWSQLVGAGDLTIRAEVSRATAVEFYLVPTGTGTWDYRTLIGRDSNGRDGWTAVLTYRDEPLLSHVVVLARGPGGTAQVVGLDLYHPDPS